MAQLVDRQEPAAVDAAACGHMLYGVKAIAAFLGIRDRQALGLVERGRLPHFHVGKIVCANRSTLVTWLAEQEAKGRRAA